MQSIARTALRAPQCSRLMSTGARPMTRFVEYPFNKEKMAEASVLDGALAPKRDNLYGLFLLQVREWLNGSDLPATLRGQPGVKDVEFSFCPGRSMVTK